MASLFERLDKMRPPVEEATPPPTEEAKEVSLFERLDKGRLPTPTEEVIKRLGEDSPIEKLRDWLVNYWAKETVTAQEAYTYGPHSIRDKKTTLRLAQILVEQGMARPHQNAPARHVGVANCSWGQLPARSECGQTAAPTFSQNNPLCFLRTILPTAAIAATAAEL